MSIVMRSSHKRKPKQKSKEKILKIENKPEIKQRKEKSLKYEMM